MKELVNLEIKRIRKIYLEDNRVLTVGFSGGKDSNVTLDLVVRALEKIDNPTKPVYVLFSDTKIEMPPTIDKINTMLDRISDYSKRKGLPIVIERVHPELKNTFFSLVIGKGYTLPRTDNGPPYRPLLNTYGVFSMHTRIKSIPRPINETECINEDVFFSFWNPARPF